VAGSHAESTNDQSGFASPTINPHNGGNSCDKHDNADNTRRQQADGGGAEAKVLEDLRRVVENGVDTRPLLEEHSHSCDNDTLEHGLALEQAADGDELELGDTGDAEILKMGAVLRERLLLEERLGLDFGEFELDEFMVLGQAAQTGENTAGFWFPVVMDEPAGRKGHKDHANAEKHSRSKL